LAFLRAPAERPRVVEERPSRRPFAMLWEVEKNGRTSWVAGTAHFFCHSFEPSFRRLFRKVDHVLFEGPLDEGFMADVDRAGRTPLAGATPILDLLDEEDILRLERVVHGPRGALARSFGLESPRTVDVRGLLANARPWCAFFSLWTAFLERQGWRESVDMEAWRVAHAMGKNVVGMESLEEQLDSLGSLPPERVVRFFRACRGWKALSRRNMRAYLAGDLEGMMGSSAEFPTRTEYVISRRDQRFRERMRPYLEEGRCAVFVGAAHMVNLRPMLAADGFSVRQAPFGLVPKLKLGLRRLRRGGEDVAW
ncbi:MAG: TraB/GumN family protein, partial [Desulfovibrio sp.]|nr:TraB/GumN family protein [Desulfovibrio sp.]